MKLFGCVLVLLFALAAGNEDQTVCRATLTVELSDNNPAYTLSFETEGDTIYFVVTARTDGWVAVGFSNDTMMPNSDVALGASDGTNSFINDRWANPGPQVPPVVDDIQNIADTAVIFEDGVTTIKFSRLRVTGDTTQDWTLDECRYFLYAWGGTVDDYSSPVLVQANQHAQRGYFEDRICIPDDCAIECPALSDPEGGSVNVTDRGLGAVATYSCVPGRYLDGASEVTCETTAMWSAPEPVCVDVMCPPLSNPVGGSVNVTGIGIDAIAVYSCDEGRAPNGESKLTCQSNSTWSAPPPMCVIIMCPVLEDPEDGIVTISSRLVGGVAEYTCEEEDELEGPSMRTCEDTGKPIGTWSPDEEEDPTTCGAGMIQSSAIITTLLALVGVLAGYLKV